MLALNLPADFQLTGEETGLGIPGRSIGDSSRGVPFLYPGRVGRTGQRQSDADAIKAVARGLTGLRHSRNAGLVRV